MTREVVAMSDEWKLNRQDYAGYRKAVAHLTVCLEDGMDIYQALDWMTSEYHGLKNRLEREHKRGVR